MAHLFNNNNNNICICLVEREFEYFLISNLFDGIFIGLGLH